MYPNIVDKAAYDEYAEDGSWGIQVIICVVIMTNTIHSVLPQPLTHGITIGMNTEYTESGGSYCIDEARLWYAQVLEEHKCCDAYQQS